MSKDKLRLLITDKCNRNCYGCCNKDWNLKELPNIKESEFKNYKIIMLTGGEPLLDANAVINISILIRLHGFKGKLFVYTAKVDRLPDILSTLHFVDGITVTLHEKNDIFPFYDFNARLKHIPNIESKSLRLNVFRGIKLVDFDVHTRLWNIKDNIEWIKDCPLPEGEEFKKWILPNFYNNNFNKQGCY